MMLRPEETMPRVDDPDPSGQALMRAILAALSDPAIVTDPGGVVLAFNASAGAAWPALAAGRPLSFAVRSPDVVDALRRLRDGETRVIGSYAERVPVEKFFDVTASILAPDAGRGEPSALLLFRDRTEQQRLDMMRVDFVANASHELRTPLASVLGFIETLQGPARDDAVARERFLGIMREQARRMARLIDDLLTLSRVEMAEHRRPEAPVDLGAVVRQVMDTLRPLADDRGVALALDQRLPAPVVPGDRDELLRVVENLIENAIKYGQSGGKVDVTLDEEPDAGTGGTVRLSVRDYGPGIAPEHVPRLTERFYRVDTGQSRVQGGTGLGLALVKHVLNRHRGRLVIESRPGEGATFRVLLPSRVEDGRVG
ncbi:ATP-binding protein [Alsobacter sp. R-9]